MSGFDFLSRKRTWEKGVAKLTSGANLLAGSSDTNNDAGSPALVTGLESRSHDTDVACAVKCVVQSSVRHLHQLLLDVLSVLQVIWVHEIRGAKLLRPRLLVWVRVDDDDPASLARYRTLRDGETDAAGAKDGSRGAFLHLCRLDGGSVPGGDSATEQTRSVHGCVLGDGHDGDVGDDGEL